MESFTTISDHYNNTWKQKWPHSCLHSRHQGCRQICFQPSTRAFCQSPGKSNSHANVSFLITGHDQWSSICSKVKPDSPFCQSNNTSFFAVASSDANVSFLIAEFQEIICHFPGNHLDHFTTTIRSSILTRSILITRRNHQHDDMMSSMCRPGQQEHPDQDHQRDPRAPACIDLEQSATEKAQTLVLINATLVNLSKKWNISISIKLSLTSASFLRSPRVRIGSLPCSDGSKDLKAPLRSHFSSSYITAHRLASIWSNVSYLHKMVPTPTSRQSGWGAKAIPRTTPAAPEAARPAKELPPELEEEEEVGEGAAVVMRGRMRRGSHMLAILTLLLLQPVYTALTHWAGLWNWFPDFSPLSVLFTAASASQLKNVFFDTLLQWSALQQNLIFWFFSCWCVVVSKRDFFIFWEGNIAEI